MEKEVIYLPKALKSITFISLHIEMKGYPINAHSFKNKLFDFGDFLAVFPEKYPVCKKPALYKKKYRCAVFKKNYIFIYKSFKTKIVVYNVIHTARYTY